MATSSTGALKRLWTEWKKESIPGKKSEYYFWKRGEWILGSEKSTKEPQKKKKKSIITNRAREDYA